MTTSQRFQRLEAAVIRFLETMPSLTDLRGFDGGDGLYSPHISPTLVRVRATALNALIILYSIPAGYGAPGGDATDEKCELAELIKGEEAERRKGARVKAALDTAEVARKLGDVALIYSHVCFGVSCRDVLPAGL